ncbi:MAG: NAD(P)/FAD-dependent oxidoreductase [Dehalococcoidales bacterium]|nr:MAG: NAD(P)/FAD-dependent oxidoreductase [Dehalococcoidales bacterium]
MYDVAVIGAGPAGSRIACKLAEYGYRVVVIEKKKDLSEPVCCTGIVSRECVRDFYLPQRIIYREANSATVYSPSNKILQVRRTEPQACIVHRSALNVYLSERAMEQGVEYILNGDVSRITRKPDRVVVETDPVRSTNMLLESRVAVVASGFGSNLTEQVGLKTVGDFAMGVQAEVETDGVEEVEVFTGKSLAPGFFAWLVPTLKGRGLAGLISRRRTGFYMKKFISLLAEQRKIIPGNRDIRFAGLALNMLTRTSSDRVLVVGSAAGQVKPATGGGVYYGMICADIAADNLHQALKSDNLTAGSLSSYDRQWKKVLGREIRTGHWGRNLYERLSDARIDKIFDIITSSSIDKTLLENDDIRFDSHSSVILKLIGHEALSRTFRAVKMPFSSENK